jgi:hypothetical protein
VFIAALAGNCKWLPAKPVAEGLYYSEIKQIAPLSRMYTLFALECEARVVKVPTN